jgi:hypothetical protein
MKHILPSALPQQRRPEPSPGPMPVRTRKLIGAFLLFALVIVWSLLAMAVAQAPFIFENRLISALYYVLAGIGWVLPAMPLISWMSKPSIRR